MRSSTHSVRIFVPALFAVLALFSSQTGAQTAPSLNAPAKPAVKSAANDSATVLPSEATVDSFLHATFGYDPQLTWKISSIVPAPVPGLAEVSVVLASPQGQQLSRFFVTADGMHALTGEIIPFGAQPFAPARKALEKVLTEEMKIDQAARQKIASQRKIIVEGSQEWDILYRKYYNDEVRKLGL